jgi:glucose-1-phosphate adenylyltransferase
MAAAMAVHAFVMAGGLGSRLQPLTQGQCKPALPFGADHRVVDFVLANLCNSGLAQVQLLVQYEPGSLIRHVRSTWSHSAQPGACFDVEVAPPRPGLGPRGYRGTADAVFQNLFRLDAADDDLVLVFGADHVYRMDVRQMIDFHRAHRADVSVATLPVPLAEAGGFGIFATDGDGRALAFQEKPTRPQPMPDRAGHALASMGNYVFTAGVLRRALARGCAASEFDFGQHVLPGLVASHRVMAYDFHDNRVPGLAADEEHGYWRDVGTLDAYFAAHLDTLGGSPRFRLDNPLWPLMPDRRSRAPARVSGSCLSRSRLGSGVVIEGALLDEAVLGRHACIGPDARLRQVLLMEGVVVGAGARLRRVIVDQDNVIPPGESIGRDLERDRLRFPVSPGGIVVVPRGHFAAAPWGANAQQPGARGELSVHG